MEHARLWQQRHPGPRAHLSLKVARPEGRTRPDQQGDSDKREEQRRLCHRPPRHVAAITAARHEDDDVPEQEPPAPPGDAAAEDVLDMPSIFIGTRDQIVEDLLRRREQYGFSYFVVSDASMEAFAPVVRRLAGNKG